MAGGASARSGEPAGSTVRSPRPEEAVAVCVLGVDAWALDCAGDGGPLSLQLDEAEGEGLRLEPPFGYLGDTSPGRTGGVPRPERPDDDDPASRAFMASGVGRSIVLLALLDPF